jgi:uncharacterized DUF497 family protein
VHHEQRRIRVDAAKAEGSFEKHGVNFEVARRVFDDAFAFEQYDFGSEPDEIRYLIAGMVDGIILTVVYTERGERIPIISARKATKHEQAEYHRSQTAE